MKGRSGNWVIAWWTTAPSRSVSPRKRERWTVRGRGGATLGVAGRKDWFVSSFVSSGLNRFYLFMKFVS